jgi:hypothetical protein
VLHPSHPPPPSSPPLPFLQTLFRVFHLVFAVLGIFVADYFYMFHLFEIIVMNPTLTNVVKVCTRERLGGDVVGVWGWRGGVRLGRGFGMW